MIIPPTPLSFWRRVAPALTLVLAAPMVAEVLPGATRFSSLFVLPIEMCVWGGGALLIRSWVRRRNLGWRSLLLLGLALALAEECLIQQTSLAPMVVHLKGVVYARAGGVNFVYLLWALLYEPVFVVLVPVALVELVFPRRRQDAWVSRGGLWAVVPCFLVGSFLAWFTWTQIARPKVFHLPPYQPPGFAVLAAGAAIAVLAVAALRPPRAAVVPSAWPTPPPVVLGALGALWASLVFGLVLLGFGIAPSFPPAAALVGGLALAAAAFVPLPHWSSGPAWRPQHRFAIVAGVVAGSMAISFVGFIGAARPDLYFKVAADAAAAVLLVALGRRPPAEV